MRPFILKTLLMLMVEGLGFQEKEGSFERTSFLFTKLPRGSATIFWLDSTV